MSSSKGTTRRLSHIPLYLLAPYLDKRDVYNNVTHTAILPQSRCIIQRLMLQWKAFCKWRHAYGQVEWDCACLQLLRNRYPRLTYEDRFCGGTGYLDGVRPSDVRCGVMEGHDIHGRSFFTIRYRCEDSNFIFDGRTHNLHTDRICCLTIFQRFTDSTGTWCKAGRDACHSRAPFMYGSQTLLNDKALALLVSNVFRMMSGLPIVYFDYTDKSEIAPSIKRYLQCKLV